MTSIILNQQKQLVKIYFERVVCTRCMVIYILVLPCIRCMYLGAIARFYIEKVEKFRISKLKDNDLVSHSQRTELILLLYLLLLLGLFDVRSLTSNCSNKIHSIFKFNGKNGKTCFSLDSSYIVLTWK